MAPERIEGLVIIFDFSVYLHSHIHMDYNGIPSPDDDLETALYNPRGRQVDLYGTLDRKFRKGRCWKKRLENE